MMILLLNVIFIFTMSCINVMSQTDSSSNNAKHEPVEEVYNAIIDSAHINESINKRDSLRISELLTQMGYLKSDEVSKKELIEKELDSLKNSGLEKMLRLKNRIDSLKRFVKGSPVIPFQDTLFTVFLRVGTYTAAERANDITNKIRHIGNDDLFSEDSLKIIYGDASTDLVYKNTYILSFTDSDEIWRDSSKTELAESYRNIVKNAVLEYKDSISLKSKLKKAGMVLIVFLIVALIIYLVSRLSNWINQKLINSKDKYVKTIKLNNYDLLTSDRLISLFMLINKYLKVIIIFALIYFSLPVLLKFFPGTKGYADTLLGYVLDPLGKIFKNVWEYLPNLITIIIIVVLFNYLLKGLTYFKNEIEKGSLQIPGFYSDWANPTYYIIRVLIYAFMVVVIFPYLPGSDSPVFQGVSVFLGFLFTFGSAGSLSNIIAGLVLTYMRSFKIGDRVKIADVTGDVIDKSLLVTRIRTIKNEDITIPNSNIMNTHTINYSSAAQELGLILNTSVTIGYDAPWRTVHKLLIDSALATDFIITEPKPFVLQTSLDDFYVSYMINVYTKEPNKQALIYSQLHQNIQDKFNEAGVEIMSPHYNSLRDGNRTSIPSDYLPEDYVNPPFKIQKQDNPDK